MLRKIKGKDSVEYVIYFSHLEVEGVREPNRATSLHLHCFARTEFVFRKQKSC